MKEKRILYISLIIGLLLTPVILRRPSYKLWSSIYVINGLLSHTMDNTLVKLNKLEYPIRLLPNFLNINLVYDYFVCPIISILYCQSSYYSKLPGIVIKGLLFGIPQICFEAFSERHTQLIKYKNGWNWIYSYLGIVAVKLMYRGLVEIWKRNVKNPVKNDKNLLSEDIEQRIIANDLSLSLEPYNQNMPVLNR